MRGVEIGDRQFADQPLVEQACEFVEGVKPFRVLEGPPVELVRRQGFWVSW
jgi:hypothetical protein